MKLVSGTITDRVNILYFLFYRSFEDILFHFMLRNSFLGCDALDCSEMLLHYVMGVAARTAPSARAVPGARI